MRLFGIPLRRLWRETALRTPAHSALALARRLVARANAERDAHRFQSASALYEEALRLVPGQPRFLVQLGHMLKEAGDLAGAEDRYREALALLPDDPELAMQLGHFYKIGGRAAEAAVEYRRALQLRPNWREAELELAGVGDPREQGHAEVEGQIAAELLPLQHAETPGEFRRGFHALQIGRVPSRQPGHRRLLRGVIAVRGFLIDSAPLSELSVRIGETELARVPLPRVAIAGSAQGKFVFNCWVDLSALPTGACEVELRATGPGLVGHRHQALFELAEPLPERDAPNSDAIVDAPPPGEDLVAAINARPTMVRPARRNFPATEPRTILVQRADQLGDLACSVPALERLRALWPAARIVGLVTAANIDLARTLPCFDELVVAELVEEPGGRRVMPLAAQVRLRETLHAYRFDLAIDLGETSGSRPLLLLSGARFLYGFKPNEFPWLDAGLELRTRDPGNHGEATAHGRKLLALVESLAALAQEGAARVAPRAAAAPSRPAYAVLHTGARLAYTRWTGFAELARLLLARTDLRVIVLADEPVADLPADDRVQVIAGRLAFDDFDGLLANAAVFVGNDSGPKHLAALRGTPSISLHMARLNWSEWGQSEHGLILSRRVPCAGCGIDVQGGECGQDFACLRHIRPEEVLAAILHLLSPASGTADEMAATSTR